MRHTVRALNVASRICHPAFQSKFPYFFGGREDGLFIGKYLAEWRREDEAEALADRVLLASFGKAGDGGGGRPLPGDSELREMNVADTPAMAAFYDNS